MFGVRPHELKLDQALHHVERFEEEASRWLAKPPYRFLHEVDLATAEKLLLVELLEPVPGQLATIAGDCLHNLRSALDNLAYELAVAHTGHPLPKRVAADSAFPVFPKQGADTPKRFARTTRGIHPDARSIIEGIQPYNLGDDAFRNILWVLHDLNAKDKHRFPHLGVPSPATVSFYIPGVQGALSAKPEWVLIEDRAVIVRYFSPPGTHAELDFSKPPTFFVALGDGSPEAIRGYNVAAALREMRRHIVERIVPPLTPYLA